MKSFFCLLLLAFIACNVIEKKEEIILKDFAHEFFEQIVNIIVNCGETNPECIQKQMTDFFNGMTTEERMEFIKLIQNPECKSICDECFSGKVSEQFTELYCKGLCQIS